ncbi:hypothetical protein F5Y12DRAFT_799336 [Xylaria sp. FL1777]|nr:hypothetical protein F5Y12DRAFT_799336 [Xylaria sp. FL1777]
MSATVELGRQRLLSDIHELVTKPYPKITLHPHGSNLYEACLILYPENYPALHLTILFPKTYPIEPPDVRMDSSVQHPNVYGDFICASILRLGDEYTPAYTLTGIAIQLLSFFDSDSVEQEYDGIVDLADYQALNSPHLVDTYECRECEFGMMNNPRQVRTTPTLHNFDERVDRSPEQSPAMQSSIHSPNPVHSSTPREEKSQQPSPWTQQISIISNRKAGQDGFDINKLPNEILLLIIESLDDFGHLSNFARAWPRVSQIVRDFDVIRQRELQCFCLKKGYQSAKLGVGVRIERGQISSEFDLISKEAYVHMGVRNSIHNIPFHHWLPLPISRRHWDKVREETHGALAQIRPHLKRPSSSLSALNAHVLFTFMNDIVVRLNQTTEKGRIDKSTLRHASEKAIESYFHLFHLLVCLATEDPRIVQQANKLLSDFEGGRRSKKYCPNLGHLLIALLISDVQVTETLIRSIIKEAIIRNVVWLLDRKGACMPELSYMESDAVSAYRLDKTFQGSRTSYRLLMFSELFRRTARSSHEKTLSQVRDQLFDRHGGPPLDAAGHLAAEVRRLHTIDNFPAFMREMGLQNIPTSTSFTNVLRQTVRESMDRGYSRWAMNQTEAMRLRIKKDPHVQLTEAECISAAHLVYRPSRPQSYDFFPNDRYGE